MSEIESFVEWVISLVSDNLYLGVFFAAFIETVFPPIPSEAVFPLAGFVILNNDMPIIHIFGVGTVGGTGSTIGAFLIYLISIRLGRSAFIKYSKYLKIKEEKIVNAEKWFKKYGDKAVLFGRMVPGIRELVSVPAGLLNMKYAKFLVFTFIGSCSWSIALTAVGYYLGVATIDIF